MYLKEKHTDHFSLFQKKLFKLFITFSMTFMMSAALADPTKISLQVSPSDLHWIADKIAANETANKKAYLTFWNKNESFPSFGIGHFIWLPAGVQVPFEETFPQMVAYVSKAFPAPQWLLELKPMHPPWQTRKTFMAAFNSKPMQELRNWLADTKENQAKFILNQFEQKLGDRISSLSLTNQWKVKETMELMAANRAGLYALLDYSNFKGLGNNPKERYQGKGWGLLDVLVAMPSVAKKSRLHSFVKTAKQLLKQRSELAPTKKQRQKEHNWLTGWYHRLDTYLKI